jgi:hypothetical protein
MAGAGYKLFATGDVLTASDVNTYLQQQTVMVFDDAAARTTALTGVVSEGMVSYLKSTNVVEVYDGSSWVSSDDPNAIQNSIVNAKGDIIGASANDVPAITSVGSNGDTLVADSSATTGLSWSPSFGFSAGKNKIINGDFGVWQRGTSFTGYATRTYTADRWTSEYNGTGATRTVSRQTFTPATAPVAGYEGQFYLSYNRSVAGTSPADYLTYRVEDVRTFAGQTATISFWAKANASMNLSDITFYQEFGSGGSGTTTTTTSAKTITTSWARYTTTVSVPSISGKTVGTSSALAIYFVLPNSGTFTFDIWGVQLEAGSVATAFQTATGTIQGELAACRRYLPAFNGSNFLEYIGYAYGTNTSLFVLPFDVPARVAPTGITTSGTIAAFALNTSTTVTPTFNTGGVYSASVLAGHTITAGQAARIQIQSGATILFTGCEL